MCVCIYVCKSIFDICMYVYTHTSDIYLGEAGAGKAADGMRAVLEMAVRCAPTVSSEEALESGEIRHNSSKSTLCRAFI